MMDTLGGVLGAQNKHKKFKAMDRRALTISMRVYGEDVRSS
jgi:hypothetical protein